MTFSSPELWIRLTALAGASGVMLGAFGAHGLKAVLNASQMANWQTAVLYQMIHVLAMLALALSEKFSQWPLLFWLAGIVLFSGSLYLHSLYSWRWLVWLTPLGGLLLILGWLALLARPGAA